MQFDEEPACEYGARVCAGVRAFVRERGRKTERERESAMRCPDCFNPTGNAAVSSVTAARACVRVSNCARARACVCVGVENPSKLYYILVQIMDAFAYF